MTEGLRGILCFRAIASTRQVWGAAHMAKTASLEVDVSSALLEAGERGQTAGTGLVDL